MNGGAGRNRGDRRLEGATVPFAFFKKIHNSSPSASSPLSEAFPECAIFGTRGRSLPHEPLPRTLFLESRTRGRLPRVQLAPGEDPASRSGGWEASQCAAIPHMVPLHFATHPTRLRSQPCARSPDGWLHDHHSRSTFRRHPTDRWNGKGTSPI
jgi:hypothetical protein